MLRRGKGGLPLGGKEIVLTASRAEMSDYGLDPFKAFYCTFPHKFFPRSWEKKYYENRCLSEDGTAKFAPYGLRKVEAILKDAFGEDVVAVCYPQDLDRFVGTRTKLIGISSMDPASLAYVSTTYNSLIGFGGIGLNAVEFKRLLSHPVFKWYEGVVMVGGAGVWQIKEANLQDELGIDVLYHGMAESDLVTLVKKILNGEKVPRDFYASAPDYSKLPLIRAPSTYGMVEITRGCGRGCAFCTPTMRNRYDIPIEHIVKEVEVNTAAGMEMVFLATEDIFLYGSKKNFLPNKEKLTAMLGRVASVPGVKYIQIAHAALAPIVYDVSVLEAITPILLPKTRWRPEYKKTYKTPFISVEVGVESGSPRLMGKLMRGKALPYKPEEWPEVVVSGFGNMNDYNWWPLATLMTGLPGETEDDLLLTLELIDDLMDTKSFLTPLVFVPIEEALLSEARRVDMERLTELQWEFITRCWKHNIDFWASESKWWINPLIFSVYWVWGRWKHGRKSFRPVMRLVGMPIASPFAGSINMCNPVLCQNGGKKQRPEKKR